MTLRLSIEVVTCLATIGLLAASEPSVPSPTNDWDYVDCGMSGGDVVLQIEYSIEGVAQQRHMSVQFRKKVFKQTASGEHTISISAGIFSCYAGTVKGAPITGMSTTFASDSPTPKGVPVTLSFNWTDRDVPQNLKEHVFVSYQGITTVTNGQFTMKAYFELNKSLDRTGDPE